MSDCCNEMVEPFQRPPREEDKKTFRVPYVNQMIAIRKKQLRVFEELTMLLTPSGGQKTVSTSLLCF